MFLELIILALVSQCQLSWFDVLIVEIMQSRAEGTYEGRKKAALKAQSHGHWDYFDNNNSSSSSNSLHSARKAIYRNTIQGCTSRTRVEENQGKIAKLSQSSHTPQILIAMSQGKQPRLSLTDFSLHARRTLPPPLPAPGTLQYRSDAHLSRSNTTLPNIPSSADTPRPQNIDVLSLNHGPIAFPPTRGGPPNDGLAGHDPSARRHTIAADLEPRSEYDKLRGQIQVLEAQIEDLRNTIDEVQQQAAAKDGQYAQIIDNATKLESRSKAEWQQWRAEREKWEGEKVEMLGTIADLRALVPGLGAVEGGPSLSVLQGNVDTEVLDGGRESVSRVQAPDTSMRASPPSAWDEIRQESDLLSEYTAKVAEMGQSIRKHLSDLDSMH